MMGRHHPLAPALSPEPTILAVWALQSPPSFQDPPEPGPGPGQRWKPPSWNTEKSDSCRVRSLGSLVRHAHRGRLCWSRDRQPTRLLSSSQHARGHGLLQPAAADRSAVSRLLQLLCWPVSRSPHPILPDSSAPAPCSAFSSHCLPWQTISPEPAPARDVEPEPALAPASPGCRAATPRPSGPRHPSSPEPAGCGVRCNRTPSGSTSIGIFCHPSFESAVAAVRVAS